MLAKPPSYSLDDTKLGVLSKEVRDYIAFFCTSEGVDMLPYVYKGSSERYDDLAKSKWYYLCREEVENISKHSKSLEQYLSGVTDIIEIGPGSEYTAKNKTLPLLQCAKSLKHYYGVDYSATYLKNALAFLEQSMRGVQMHSIETDILNGQINLGRRRMRKKSAILFLGSTLGNFFDLQIYHIVYQLSTMSKSGDILIMTFDANQDHESLIRAYTNDRVKQFLNGVFAYFATLNPDFKDHINSFDLKAEFDKQTVTMYFWVKKDLSFYLPNYGSIALKKDQKLRGITSRKLTIDYVSSTLLANNFEIIDALSASGRMITIVGRRI